MMTKSVVIAALLRCLHLAGVAAAIGLWRAAQHLSILRRRKASRYQDDGTLERHFGYEAVVVCGWDVAQSRV